MTASGQSESRNEGSRSPVESLVAYCNAASAGFCLLDRELRYVAINDVLAALNGMPAPEHLQKTVQQVPGAFNRTMESELQRARAAAGTFSFEFSGTCGREETGHWLAHCIPVGGNGGTEGLGCVVIDISPQKKLQMTLEHTGEKLRQQTGALQMLLEISSILASNWRVQKVFPRISARIRRFLHHEYADLGVLDPASGLLERQAMDFPLGKGLLSGIAIGV